MKKCQKVTIQPLRPFEEIVKDIESKVVTTLLGNINVYTDYNDPYALQFMATDDQQAAIQTLINECMKMVETNMYHTTSLFLSKLKGYSTHRSNRFL